LDSAAVDVAAELQVNDRYVCGQKEFTLWGRRMAYAKRPHGRVRVRICGIFVFRVRGVHLSALRVLLVVDIIFIVSTRDYEINNYRFLNNNITI
jgi:hypothetical protein